MLDGQMKRGSRTLQQLIDEAKNLRQQADEIHERLRVLLDEITQRTQEINDYGTPHA